MGEASSGEPGIAFSEAHRAPGSDGVVAGPEDLDVPQGAQAHRRRPRGRCVRAPAYFVDEANVCWMLYRQWIPDLRASSPTTGCRKRTSTRQTPPSCQAGATRRQPLRSDAHWHASTISSGGQRRRSYREHSGPRSSSWTGQGDLAPDARPRRRPHLRPDERDRRASRRELDPRGCTTACCCRCSSGATRSSTSTSTRGTRARDAHVVAIEAMRGHLVGPERDRRHRADRARRPLRPALRPLRLGPAHGARRLDRGHTAAHGAAVQLDGVAGEHAGTTSPRASATTAPTASR